MLGLEGYLNKMKMNKGDLNSLFGKKVFSYKDDAFDSLKNSVDNIVRRGDFVLLKGSRGLSLERLESVLFKIE